MMKVDDESTKKYREQAAPINVYFSKWPFLALTSAHRLKIIVGRKMCHCGQLEWFRSSRSNRVHHRRTGVPNLCQAKRVPFVLSSTRRVLHITRVNDGTHHERLVGSHH